MVKRTLIALGMIVTIGLGTLKFLYNTPSVEWGHPFSFDNQLGIEIDSLEITVGDVKTVINKATDNSTALEGNIGVPDKGYPHKVTLKIYSHEQSMILKADSFDCFNCDGSHEYKLVASGAVYKFLN